MGCGRSVAGQHLSRHIVALATEPAADTWPNSGSPVTASNRVIEERSLRTSISLGRMPWIDRASSVSRTAELREHPPDPVFLLATRPEFRERSRVSLVLRDQEAAEVIHHRMIKPG